MEFVYVVKRNDLFVKYTPHGFVPLDDCIKDFYGFVPFDNGFFIERRRAEKDPSFKQVIPYTVVTRGTEILVLKRLPAGNEPRLHHKLSIGVGGHINPKDLEKDRDNFILAAALRELREELYLPGDINPQLIGLVNNENDRVGAVHVGLVFLLRIDPSGFLGVRETDQLSGSMMPLGKVQMMLEYENFETWSQMVVDRLGDVLKEDGDA